MSQYTGIARPYARALFELAKERNALGAWSVLLRALKQALSFDKVSQFFQDPSVTLEAQVAFLEGLVKDQNLEGSANFIRLVVQKKRTFALALISDLFEDYKSASENEKQINVMGAYELSNTEKQMVCETLKQKFNQTVKVSFGSDPDLVGGVVIKVNDWVIDASVRGKLNQLKNNLTA